MNFVQKYLLQIWIAKENLLQWKNTAREIAAIDVLAKVTFWKYCFSLILNCLDAEKKMIATKFPKPQSKISLEIFEPKILPGTFNENVIEKILKKRPKNVIERFRARIFKFLTEIFKPKFSIQKFFRALENWLFPKWPIKLWIRSAQTSLY